MNRDKLPLPTTYAGKGGGGGNNDVKAVPAALPEVGSRLLPKENTGETHGRRRMGGELIHARVSGRLLLGNLVALSPFLQEAPLLRRLLLVPR